MKIMFITVREENVDPLSVELLSALARREGHETFLNLLEHGNLEADIRTIQPEIVAYSAKTGESNILLRANQWIKSQWGDRIVSIMGGPHPTFNHARMRLRGENYQSKNHSHDSGTLGMEETHMDYLAVGEADESWPALLQALDQGKSADSIPGILTPTNRQADGSIPIPNRTNFLDDLPFYDRELVYAKTQLKHFGMRTFMASRGCPYPCTYCFNAKYNELYRGKGKTINRYSVDRLLEELLHLKTTYPTQFIKFWDDIFIFRTDDWMIEFADKYPRVIGLPFHCLTRADLVRKDPSIIEVLKRAGLHSITMSIESGNPFIRRHIFKRGMEEEDVRFAFAHCHALGVKTFSNNILAVPAPVIPTLDDPDFGSKSRELTEHLSKSFAIKTDEIRELLQSEKSLSEPVKRSVVQKFRVLGLREETLEYDLETIDININNRVTSAEFVQLSPYPGTTLTEYTIDVGAFDGDFEKLPESFQTESPFTCFTPQEKMQQLNLSLLGPVLLLFPSWRNFFVKHFVRRAGTRFYFLMYFLVRGYVLGARIYPMKYTLHQLVNKIKTSFTRELNRHFVNRQAKFETSSPRTILSPPADILGGPWRG
ncbi:MAG: radical SAM protein [Terriglobia bacterium]